MRQKLHQHKKFRITRINEDFSLCDTYPQTLVTLSTSSDEDLRKVAAFRSRHRLPAVVWKHPKKDAYIARCAQPCVGLKRGHSSDDERFLSEMRGMSPHFPPDPSEGERERETEKETREAGRQRAGRD